MGRIVRIAALALAVALAGCGPHYTQAEATAFQNAKAVNDQLARDHKITWTEASRRNIAEATRIAGDRVTDADRLGYSYRLALAAEVDAGRMTPELAQFRYDERMAAEQAAAQQRQAQTLQAIGNALQAGAQASRDAQNARQNRSIDCTSTQWGPTMVHTTCD